MTNTYTPPTFNQEDIPGWKTYLKQEGFVVLRNILPSETREEYFLGKTNQHGLLKIYL